MMAASRPAAGGGRWVEVAPERLEKWLAGFTERHAVTAVESPDYGLRARTDDGTVAEFHVPFPPLAGDDLPALVDHARRERHVGVLLVRLNGFAAGVFAGNRLIESKVDSRLVHGRAAAGGWSQKRFARRREGQARAAYDAAAAVAQRILAGADLDAIVTGGDRRAVDAVLADDRLTGLCPLVVEPFLTTPDPKRAVLEATPAQFRATRIRIIDP
ncbi:MAG TPA: acVLRF1 family peptidyl-tRNA hydrolase [Mycobacteriales bacterium]|nr:acVLRF1 family peptidyl-tRNA hydrolase [Mycobacteriales bacterium]